jgi:hypothetical protein
MAIISRSAGRGSAIAAAAAAAAANSLRNQVVQQTVNRLAAAQPTGPTRGSVVRQPAPVVTRAPVATQSLVQQAVQKAVQRAPVATQSLVQQAVNRGAASSAAPPPPRNVIAEILTKNAKYANPVRGSGHLTIGRGYDSIEDQRAAASYTMGPMGSIAPIAPRPTAGALRYGNQSLVLQQQLADYDLMRMQAGQPPTQMGGYGPEYTVGGGGAAIRPRPRGQTIPPVLPPPPGTFVPLDLQPTKQEPIVMPPQDDLPPGFELPHPPPPPPKTNGGSAVRPRPRGQTRPSPQGMDAPELPSLYTLTPEDIDSQRPDKSQPTSTNQQPSVGWQLTSVRAQIAQMENQQRMGYQPLGGDVDTLVQLYAMEDQLSRDPNSRYGIDDFTNDVQTVTAEAVEQAGEFVPESLRDAWNNDQVQDLVQIISDPIRVFSNPVGTGVQFVNDPVGTVQRGATWFDEARQWNTENIGRGFAFGVEFAEEGGLDSLPGMEDFSNFLSVIGATEKLEDLMENGYTSPDGEQFTGGRAVWEWTTGQLTDDLPWYWKYPIRIYADLVVDPLTYLFAVAKLGKIVNVVGKGMRNAPRANVVERIIGSGLQAVGRGTEIAARFPDEAVMTPIRAGIWAGGRAGVKRPGILQLSDNVLQSEADRGLTGARQAFSRVEGMDLDGPISPNPPPDSALVDLHIANGIDETTVTFEGRTVTVSQQDGMWQVLDENGDLIATATTRREGVAVAARTVKGVDPPQELIDDAVPDELTVQRVDQETGEVLGPYRAEDIPAEFPMIRQAVTRTLTRDPALPRVAGDPINVTNITGTRLDDIAARAGVQAIDAGDTITARDIETFLSSYEEVSTGTIGRDPAFMSWSENGEIVDISKASWPITPGEQVMLSRPGSTAQAMRNKLIKGAMEHIYRLWNEGTEGAGLWADHLGGRSLPTRANPLFRTTSHANWMDERFEYLAERFVRTPDVDEAREIMRVLRAPHESYIGEFAGKPYLKAIPPGVASEGAERSLQNDLYGLLKQTREAYQTARQVQPQPQVTNQMRGGLRRESHKLADDFDQLTKDEQAALKRGAAKDRKTRPTVASVDPAAQPRITVESFSSSRSADTGATDTARFNQGVTPDDISVQGFYSATNDATGRKIERTSFTNKKGERVAAYRLLENGKYVSTAQAKRAADFLNDMSPLARNAEDEAFSTESIISRVKNDLTDPSAGQLPGGAMARAGADLVGRAGRRIGQYRDAVVEMAEDVPYADIVTDRLRRPLELAAPGFSRDHALLLDKVIDWKPARKARPGDPDEWRVIDALDEIDDMRLVKPDFDYDAAYKIIAYKSAGVPAPVTKTGKTSKAIRGLDNAHTSYMNAMRQVRRYNPLVIVRNIIGDTIGQLHQGIVQGRGEVLSAINPYRIGQDVEKLIDLDLDMHRLIATVEDEWLVGTGQIIPVKIGEELRNEYLYPYKLIQGASRGEDAVAALPGLNRRVAGRGRMARTGASLWTSPRGKHWLTLLDFRTRTETYRTLNRQFGKGEARKAFIKRLQHEAGDEYTAGMWANAIEAEAKRKAKGRYRGAFSPKDVETALAPYTAKNTDLSRMWQGQLNKSSDQALKGTEDAWFSYKNTNADEIARRVFVFHYWQSRATPLHIRAALRNPALLNGYYKMWQELEQIAEDQNYPPYLDLMFRFMQSPSGIEAFFNPLGVLLPTTLWDAYNESGGAAAVFVNQMSPWISAAISVGGWMGDDFSPNMFGTKTIENFFRKFINFGIGQGYDPADIPVIGQLFDPNTMKVTIPSEDFVNWMIGKANGLLQSVDAPTVEPFEPFNRGANELDQQRTWVQQVATSDEFFGPDRESWTPEQEQMYQEALVGVGSGLKGNPILDAAMERYGNEEGLSAALGLVAPGGAVVNSRFRTDTMAAATGGDPQARDFRNEATAADPTWVIASRAYHDIGTPLQQDIWDTYYDILFNPEDLRHQQLLVWDEEAGIYRRIPGSALAGMTDEELQEAADWWLSMYPGGQEAIDHIKTERDAFKAAHPEFTTYLTYQKGVYDYPGGSGQFLTDMESNPNFQQALDEQREYLQKQGYKGATLQAELEQWAASEEAYHAAIGDKYNIYDNPISVYDGSNDPYANNPFRTVMEQGTPVSEDDEEEVEDEIDPKSPAGQAAKWEAAEIEEEKRRGWSNYAAEELYGDAWDQEAAATDPKKGFPYKTNDPLTGEYYYTNYYPDDAPPKPGESSNENRFIEWQRVMRAQGVPENQLTVEAWAAWETDTYEEYLESTGQSVQSETAVPDLWTYWLDDKRAA